MLIHQFLVICTTLLVVVTCKTVSVDNGENIKLTWTVTAPIIEVHYDKVNYAFIAGSTITITDAAKSKFGNRFKVTKSGTTLTVIIENAKKSDEGKYDALERPGGGTQFVSAGVRTLSVEGLSSSDKAGVIAGSVIGSLAVLICIIIVCYCHRKKKRSSGRHEESAVPMNEQPSSEKVEKYEPPQNKYDGKVIYSELGPGGRQGPRPVINKSEYASVKDV